MYTLCEKKSGNDLSLPKELQILTMDVWGSNNASKYKYLAESPLSLIVWGMAGQNLVKCQYSHINDTAFIKQISLFDTTLVMTNT